MGLPAAAGLQTDRQLIYRLGPVVVVHHWPSRPARCPEEPAGQSIETAGLPHHPIIPMLEERWITINISDDDDDDDDYDDDDDDDDDDDA